MRNFIVLLCLFLLSAACNGSEAPTESSNGTDKGSTTVYLVRHAEKGDGEDPDLTAEGKQRAQRLSDLLADEAIVAVYSTAFQRTRQTATPTAKHHNLSVTDYDAGQLDQFAQQIVDSHRGGAVLVVGHSNTTPELAGILSEGKQFDAISEDDYGNLLVITLPSSGRPSVERRTY